MVSLPFGPSRGFGAMKAFQGWDGIVFVGSIANCAVGGSPGCAVSSGAEGGLRDHLLQFCNRLRELTRL